MEDNAAAVSCYPMLAIQTELMLQWLFLWALSSKQLPAVPVNRTVCMHVSCCMGRSYNRKLVGRNMHDEKLQEMYHITLETYAY